MHLWLKANKLSLNLEKTKVLPLGMPYKIANFWNSNYKLNYLGKEVELVSEARYLGVLLDSALSFKSHSEEVINKANRNIGIINAIRPFIPVHYKFALIDSLVISIFSYCINIYSVSNKSCLNKLSTTYKRAVKSAYNFPILMPTNEVFKISKWLSFERFIEYKTLLFMFKIRNGMTVGFEEWFVPRGQIHGKNTRSSCKYDIIWSNTSLASHRFSIIGPQEWNKLPEEIQMVNSIGSFKQKVKGYLKLKEGD